MPADAEALVRCIGRAYAPARARIEDLPDVSGGVAEDIEAGRVWVAVRAEEVLGCLILDTGSAKLMNIAVDPEAGGQGVGRALLDLAETLCAAAGHRQMTLVTHIAMPENVEMYRHLGWQETGREGNKVFMAKALI